MADSDASSTHDLSLRAQISRAVVSLMKEHYGRGPVSTKTYLMDDVVLVVLSGGFSQVEATLMAAGEGQAVNDQRAIFQEAMRGRFNAAVEQIVGRKVVSFMSANDQDGNMTSELFILESRGPADEAPSETT